MFFSKKTVRVSVRNKKIVIETKTGVNLYKFLVQEGIILPTLCDGAGQCGKCKIKFLNKDIPKPRHKDSLILAKINIDAGYRLACQHTIKNDIEIDTSEISSSVKFLDDYPKAIHEEINKMTANVEEEERINFSNIKDVISEKVEEPNHLPIQEAIKVIEDEEYSETTADMELLERDLLLAAATQTGELEKLHKDEPQAISLSEFGTTKLNPKINLKNDVEGPSDGIFLIQQRNGVRYFCYSAALDNIVSEGVTATSESLREVIDNSRISDFIHNVLKIRDIDRVLILIDSSENYITVNILDMVNYFRFELGTLLCEVIMPYSKNYDIIRFFRLLNVNKDNRLIFSLDMLDKAHYITESLFTEMRFSGLTQTNMTSIKDRGKNPITEFTDDLLVKSVEHKGADPDGLTLSAFLQFVKLLQKNGIIDINFNIRSRKELMKQSVSLNLAVRVAGNETSTGFFVYRDRFGEIILTQSELYMLRQIRGFILATVKFAEQFAGKPNGLVFYTTTTHDNLINHMFDLGFIPKEYADKISYNPGEATVQAVKLFKEKDIPSFLSANFNNIQTIDLVEEDSFIQAAKNSGLL